MIVVRPWMIALLGSAALLVPAARAQSEPAQSDPAQAKAQAERTLAQLTTAEKLSLTHGVMPVTFLPDAPPPPAGSVPGAGYVPGIPRLGVPALTETDAGLGVAWLIGIRHDGATALPAGVAMAASWNPPLLRRGGAMIGAEAHAKGFNVLLAGGANLMRDPRNGRTFEYLSEDPLLTGMLAGAAIAGIQSNAIISTIKHYALNGQETGRKEVDSRISEAAARESDLLAFQIGIEQGQPGSVMCAYNLVNGVHACDSDWLLNTLLKRDWAFPGFVMSDWGAVPGVEAAIHGLDQQSGANYDPVVYFDKPLAQKVAADPAWAARLDDMARRVLTAIYAHGLDTHPAIGGAAIDFAADSDVALEIARQGIVLLKNRDHLLPLARTAKRIAVIGGYADTGVISGGGSSQVEGKDGPAASVPLGGDGPLAPFAQQQYHRSSPLRAIVALAPGARVIYRSGAYLADAVAQAKQADVAIVFATKWASEGMDVPDLTLPDGQDALIAAVVAANPHTIVVLETGNPVAMPWLDKAAGVIEAWFSGARGGEAIASVLFGETNPSGRLPISFPASESQLPRPVLDGYFQFEPDAQGEMPQARGKLAADYNIEGSDVGYRWYARQGLTPLFPFGFGLSYSSFTGSDLHMQGLNAGFTLANTGARDGATVGQLYLVLRPGKAQLRLVGFQRVALAAGARQMVQLRIDPRLLADWRDGGWSIDPGAYRFALGDNAGALGAPVTVQLAARRWHD